MTSASLLPMNTSTTNVPRALLRRTSLAECSIDETSDIVSEKDNSNPRIARRRSIGSFSSVDQESSLAMDGLVFTIFHTSQPFDISV